MVEVEVVPDSPSAVSPRLTQRRRTLAIDLAALVTLHRSRMGLSFSLQLWRQIGEPQRVSFGWDPASETLFIRADDQDGQYAVQVKPRWGMVTVAAGHWMKTSGLRHYKPEVLLDAPGTVVNGQVRAHLAKGVDRLIYNRELMSARKTPGPRKDQLIVRPEQPEEPAPIRVEQRAPTLSYSRHQSRTFAETVLLVAEHVEMREAGTYSESERLALDLLTEVLRQRLGYQ